MKLRKPTRLLSVLFSMLAVVSLLPAQLVFAAGNTIYLSPSTQTVQPGQSFTVQMRGTVGAEYVGANRVAGAVTFPANLLQATSVVSDGTSFNWQPTASIGSGVVNFDQRSFFPIQNANVYMMTITFKALTSGTANVNFATGTTYSYGASPLATTITGGSYRIAAPTPTTCPAGQVGTPPNCTTPAPAQCPAGQTGTPPNCKAATCPTGQTGTPPNCKTSPTPTTPTTPTTPKTPTTPQKPEEPSTPVVSPNITQDTTPDNGFSISDVTATRSYKTATLNWKTSSASKATIGFGTSLKDLNKTVEGTKLPDETYEAQITDITPGKQYYYTITATSETDSSKTDSYSGVFTARGYPVAITVTENKAQVANAKVKIGEQNYSTDKTGKLSLELASGSYTIEVKTQSNTKKFSLAVAKKTIPENGNAPEIQKFSFDIPVAATTGTNNTFTLIAIGLGVGGLLLGGLIFWLWKRRQDKDAPAPTAIVATDNDYTWNQPAAAPVPVLPQNPYIPAPPPVPDQAYTETPVPAIDTAYTQPEVTPTLDESVPIDQQVAALTPDIPQEQAPLEEPQLSQEHPQGEASVASTLEPAYSETLPEEPLQQEYVEPTQPEISSPSYDPSIQSAESEQLSVQQSDEPPAQIIQTASGSELQINHGSNGGPERHNSVYLDEEEPQDMFEAAKK